MSRILEGNVGTTGRGRDTMGRSWHKLQDCVLRTARAQKTAEWDEGGPHQKGRARFEVHPDPCTFP